MALVYQITNLINSHRYIGYTSKSFEHRLRTHFCAASCKKPKQVISSAIKKYGKASFAYEIIQDNLSIDDAWQLEAKLIAERNPEYNVASGGRNPFHGVSFTDERKARMSAIMKGRKPAQSTIDGARRNNKLTHIKATVCLNDKKVFSSILEASGYYQIGKELISNVCRGVQISAGGRHFAFYHEGMTADKMDLLFEEAKARMAKRSENIKNAHAASSKIRRKPVICLNDGSVYASASVAAKFYNCSTPSIIKLCRSGRKAKSGLMFVYKGEDHKPFPKVSTRDKVLNVDDGIIYENVVAAAQALGRPPATVAQSIKLNYKCAGKRLAYAA